jgi:energy-coupling factor transport system permease protein
MRLTLYRDARSVLHRMDPRVKLLALAAGCGSLLLFTDPRVLWAPYIVLFAVAVAGRVARPYLAGGAFITALGGLSFVIWPLYLTLRGHGGPLAWQFGLGMGLRLVTMLLAGYLLMLTTRAEEILAALSRFGVPFPAVFALGLTFRLVPALVATAANVVEAQKLRGYAFDRGGPLARVRQFVPLLIPILGGALRSAHRMAWALEAKGFGSGTPRTSWLALRMRAVDWAATAVMLSVVVLSVWARHSGIGVLAGRPF